MDGLMIDTEAPVQACCQMAASEMGFTLDDEFYVDALVGRGWDDCYEALSARFGPVFSISEFVRRFNDKWKLHLRAGIEVKPGLRELLAMLRSRCVPIAVATSTDSDEAKASLASARLDGRSRSICCWRSRSRSPTRSRRRTPPGSFTATSSRRICSSPLAATRRFSISGWPRSVRVAAATTLHRSPPGSPPDGSGQCARYDRVHVA